jgi:hypothetical protein
MFQETLAMQQQDYDAKVRAMPTSLIPRMCDR